MLGIEVETLISVETVNCSLGYGDVVGLAAFGKE